MALEDKDFITIQIKQMVRNMGKMLGLETVKDLLAMDAFMKDVDSIEVETIYYVELIHDIQQEAKLEDQVMADQLGLDLLVWQALYQNERPADRDELNKLEVYFQTL